MRRTADPNPGPNPSPKTDQVRLTDRHAVLATAESVLLLSKASGATLVELHMANPNPNPNPNSNPNPNPDPDPNPNKAPR